MGRCGPTSTSELMFAPRTSWPRFSTNSGFSGFAHFHKSTSSSLFMGSLSTTGRAIAQRPGYPACSSSTMRPSQHAFAATIVQGGDEYHIGTGLFGGTGACGVRGKRYDARVIGGRLRHGAAVLGLLSFFR